MATASTGIGPNAYVELCGHELVELAAGLWRSFAGIAFAMPAKGPPPSSATMLRGRCGPAAGQGSRYWPAHARTLRLLTQGGGAQDKTGRLFTKFVSRKLPHMNHVSRALRLSATDDRQRDRRRNLRAPRPIGHSTAGARLFSRPN